MFYGWNLNKLHKCGSYGNLNYFIQYSLILLDHFLIFLNEIFI